MCGIFCSNSNDSVKKDIIKGLHFLEYRGYDSAGLAFIQKNKLKVIKALGKVSNLEEKINSTIDDGKIGIGHTRWATHGKVTLNNSHPISNQEIAVVHNGIIENYKEIKNKLIKFNYEFKGDTDTEVILNLLQYYIDSKSNYLEAFKKTISDIEGNYAISVIFFHEKNNIFCTKNGSPLSIGLGESGNYVASDINTLTFFVEKIITLEDGDIAIIAKDDYKIFDSNNNAVKRNIQEFTKKEEDNELSGFPNYMLKEINDQPRILKKIIQNIISEKENKNLSCINWANVSRISIVACGSSYNAGMVAKYWFETYAKIAVEIDFASEFKARNIIYDKDAAYVFISQSGETLDTLVALKEAQKHNVITIGLVNNLNSSIANLAKYIVAIEAGIEISVASTKSFIAQLMKLLNIVLIASTEKKLMSKDACNELLKKINNEINTLDGLLEINKKIEEISQSISKAKNIIFIGRNYMYPICLEGALKLKELSYLPVFACAAGELKHGSIALIDENSLIIALAPENSTHQKMISNIEEIKTRGSKVVLLTDSINDFEVEHMLNIPKSSEILTPLLYTIPLQLFAYQVALNLGKNVDRPRNLAKSVTVE
ncbi:MAG: glutamine--fructose-6-phosphate transaminase (isomerizing) [Candidatus Midichloriaceae bacterium]